MKLNQGDIVIELATRIDTQTIWKEVKARGCHFLNSGFDVWPDITLDLDLMDGMVKDPAFSKGKGLTSVFSFGCNPGIASHFVRHGLYAATGIEDVNEAAKAFGLRSVSFNERDTQWGKPGSEGEKTLISTQLDVLYNTWSPGNYIVETNESTILYWGCPEEAKTINSAGPAVIGWVPSGPNIGFLAPHDETFTIQEWFETPVPAVFVYEAPPTARAYIKGGRCAHSSNAVCKLLTPAKYDIGSQGYDLLGALLFSNKPNTPPFWCGIHMDVADANVIDSLGDVGPTPFQVTGGLWSALCYIMEHPDAGDCFPEMVPTPFVVSHAFPWAGTLIARSAPEALLVPGLFDPSSPDSLNQILNGEPAEGRIAVQEGSKIHGKGVFALIDLPLSCNVQQLAYEPFGILDVISATAYNHSDTPNAYIDRNRAVRTSRAITKGEEITINYSLYATRELDGKVPEFACTASELPKAYLAHVVATQAILNDEVLKSLSQ